MLLNPRHSRPGPVARAWRGFRRWRVSRPFWGGLLTLLAGLEIFGTTQMSGDGLRVQMGPSGFLSWLIPTILIACGVLLWITPQQRPFYSIVAVMTAVFSLVAVNLGGFFIGMLLGLVGGALGFAWTPNGLDRSKATAPGEPQPAAGANATADTIEMADAPGSTAQADGTPVAPEPPAESGPVRRPDPPASAPLVAIVVLGCLVAAAGVATTGSAGPAYAAPLAARAEACPTTGTTPSAQPGSPTKGAPDAPSRSTPSPTPAPAAPTNDGGGRRGNIITDIIGGIWDLLTGGARQPSAGPTPEPSRSTPEPGPSTPKPSTPKPSTPKPSTPAGNCPSSPGRPAAPTAAPTTAPAVPRLAAEPGQPLVNREPSRLTGSKVTMYGLRMDGIVDLPTADGSLRTLRFSMQRAVTEDFELRIPGPGGRTLDIRSSALTVKGNVRFYATSFTGRFLGIPLTLTPDSPIPPDGIPLTLPLISFDDPQIRLAFVECDELTAPDLVEAFR